MYRIVKLPDCNPFFLCLISPPLITVLLSQLVPSNFCNEAY
ncbi:hypothetical protein HMPREF1554_01781 [Porphyromonas gingivalis F0569]|nr:hypothetical protein HMPREF1554_01781 [Porphyromonas gingivalis F0569]